MVKVQDMSSLVRTQGSRSESQPGDEWGHFGLRWWWWSCTWAWSYECAWTVFNFSRKISKSGHMSTRSALSDRLISIETLLHFSTSDLQYFLKSVLYFLWICIFWFVANRFKIWSSDHVTCIAWFQIWPPGCVTRVAKLSWNVLLALSVSIGLVSSSARVTSVKSAKGLLVSYRHSNP